MAFSNALRTIMDERGLKARDLVQDGLSAQYMSKLLSGKVKDPTWEKALLIIDALGMAPSEFHALEKGLEKQLAPESCDSTRKDAR